jgi:hypothetical protein
MERHPITFADLVGLHRLDRVELGGGPTPLAGTFLNLLTDGGRFTFQAHEVPRERVPAIDHEGWWEPGVEVPERTGLIVMLRTIPAPDGARRVYCVDEASGLVVLELGHLTRADDPNLRSWRGGWFRWEHGAGWESPYLVEPEVGTEPIRRKWVFSPKRVRGAPAKGRY